MQIAIKDNFPEVQRWLDTQSKQPRYAAAVALTRTAQDVRVAERDEMTRVFEAPTPYTLNSLYLKFATVLTLTAEVWLKDDRAGSGTPATRYLLPQIQGGERGQKGFERALVAHGLMDKGARAVPTSAVKLDRYGNVPRGTMVQILSQLRVQMTAGYESRATGSKRSKRNIRKQGVIYFVLRKPHGKLMPGIYGRHEFAHGSAVKPLFLFADAAHYKVRFRFFTLAERVINERFPRHFEAEFARALATAR